MPEQPVIIVTGAGSGIGRSCALDLAGCGFAVVVSDVDTDGGEESVKLVEKEGHCLLPAPMLITRGERGSGLVRHRLVRQAGRRGQQRRYRGEAATTGEYPIESWQQVIDVNLSGVFYGMRYQIPAMIDGGGGGSSTWHRSSARWDLPPPAPTSLPSTASSVSPRPPPRSTPRRASWCAVGPEFIETPLLENADLDDATRGMLVQLHPIGRLGQPEEVAALVGWLCDESPLPHRRLPPHRRGYLTR